MPLFDESYLNYLIDEAERQLSIHSGLIFDRFSVAVTQGSSILTLPSGIIGIHRVTWKGEVVEPSEFMDFDASSWFKPQNTGVEGKPKFYLRRMNGYDEVQLYPIPNESLSGGSDTFAQLALTTLIDERLIFSVVRVADPTNENLRLPVYLFRNVMKYRAMAQAYAKEGKTQNLEAAKYMQTKYDFFERQYMMAMSHIPRAVINTLEPTNRGGRAKIPRPTLPTGGKWGF